MQKSTLIYYNSGDSYRGTFDLTPTQRKQWHKTAKENGQIGYLTGYHYYDNKKHSVICYFREQPSQAEIEKRHSNRFIRATWYWL